MSDTLLEGLAARLARPVAESERQRARLHLLDWLACVAGGRECEAGLVGRAVSRIPWEQSTYIGNAMEMDDIHRKGLLHPGPVVWPAAMSWPSADLNARLDAAVRGYEAMIAVGAALDAYHYAHWHPTTTAGFFGAAAAFGSLIGSNKAEYENGLGNAGSVAGGFWHLRHDNTLAKQWHVYHVVRTGRDAMLHVHYGATGPKGLLEGPQGMFAGMTRQPGSLAEAADGGWLIGEVSFKPFASCRHSHPTIDAAMTLRERGELHAPFTVETFADAILFCDRPDPKTVIEAKFSLQHVLAVVADGRKAEPADFTEKAIAELADLRAQVSVAEAEEFTSRYPEHFGARVNGLAIYDTLGDPERPVSQAQLVEKFHMLAQWGGVSEASATRAVDLALHGDDAEAIDALLEEWLA